MTQHLTAPLLLIPPTTSGCGCCQPKTSATPLPTPGEEAGSSTTTVARSYAVTGMTCSHCAAAVNDELSAIPGVTAVHVDLVAGGNSTVTISSDTALTGKHIAAALDEAGDYHLTA